MSLYRWPISVVAVCGVGAGVWMDPRLAALPEPVEPVEPVAVAPRVVVPESRPTRASKADALGAYVQHGPAALLPETDVQINRESLRQLDEVVVTHLEPIRDCYREGLATDAGLEGGVLFDLEIDGDGTVSSAVVHHASMADPYVLDCMEDALYDLSFARAPGTVRVRYPMHFAATPIVGD